MSRYIDAPKACTDLAESIISEHFPDLHSLSRSKIKILLDSKKKMSKGKLCLGSCQKPNEMVKHFTIPETKDAAGYQYIIPLDAIAWDVMNDVDKVRLLRHELRHVGVMDDDNPKPSINPHDLEDFCSEAILNVDDPDWARKVAKKVLAIYGS